ncbi:MAG: hypothetical protein VX404_07480, partial [Planctomycetota bacterium]|nr:hypothetical protein [Planctomycetota bacterium]
GITGTFISAAHPELPAGPVIVLSATGFFTFSLLAAPKRGLIARRLRWKARKRQREVRKILHTLLIASEQDQDFLSTDQILAGAVSASPRALQQAIREGFIQKNDEQIQLTELGEQRALRARKSQEIWREWLTSEAAIDRDLIDLDEEEVEKLLPTELVRTLEHSIHLREATR